MIEQKFGQWWLRDDWRDTYEEETEQMAKDVKAASGGCGCGGCGCGGGGKKKGREGQPVDDEGRINLGLRSAQ